MWVIVSWSKKDGSDATVLTNEDGSTMVFGSRGEALGYALGEINRFYQPILLFR